MFMYLEINLEREALRDAFAKSDAVKPQVRAGQCTEASASYKVISSDSQTWYEVEFTRSMSGRPFGSCSCIAGHDGFYCYHLTAALYVHCGLVQHGLRPSVTRSIWAQASAAISPNKANSLLVR